MHLAFQFVSAADLKLAPLICRGLCVQTDSTLHWNSWLFLRSILKTNIPLQVQSSFILMDIASLYGMNISGAQSWIYPS